MQNNFLSIFAYFIVYNSDKVFLQAVCEVLEVYRKSYFAEPNKVWHIMLEIVNLMGQDVYPTVEEKAANLLYFVTKNHSFSDGNKRIAATMFLYFLDKNGILFREGEKTIADYTLVALTIMIAESRPDEKEMMVTVFTGCHKQ